MNGAAKMLIVFVDETDMHGDVPLYEAIIRRLVRHEIAGATAVTGIMGYGSHVQVHKRGLFGISDDRPVAVMSVDSEEKLRKVVPEIRSMVKEGMVLLTDVDVLGPVAADAVH